MIDLASHKRWIGLLALAGLIAGASGPLLGVAQHKLDQKRVALKAETRKASDALYELQRDIADSEKMKTEIDLAAAKKILAPADRLRAAQIMEQRAAEAHLTHFSYTLSPEQKTFIDTPEAGKQQMANSTWTLAADTPTDTDAYIFLDALARTMPGRIALHALSLQRIGDKDAQLTPANIHVTASGDWLSNGASKNLAEQSP